MSRCPECLRSAGRSGIGAVGLVTALLAISCGDGGQISRPYRPVASVTAATAASFSPSDPLREEQWAIDAVNLPEAWNASTGSGVVIAIVDTGVDLDHPDLVSRLIPGWDFVDNDDQPDDPNGHGTHVAGIAAATANDIGIVGAAPEASIMPVRVLDAAGNGSDEVIASGIRWAAANGADVINLSLGEEGFISRFTKGGSLNGAVRQVSAEGVVVVAAAGNEGSIGWQYRIGVDVLVVSATAPDGSLSAFSNIAGAQAISAPGVDVLSTAPVGSSTLWPEGTDGYTSLDGTSMAAPLVSGVAALLIADGVPAAEVIDRLVSTATNPTNDPRLGAGIVAADAAVTGVTAAGSAGEPPNVGGTLAEEASLVDSVPRFCLPTGGPFPGHHLRDRRCE